MSNCYLFPGLTKACHLEQNKKYQITNIYTISKTIILFLHMFCVLTRILINKSKDNFLIKQLLVVFHKYPESIVIYIDYLL